MKNLLLVGVLMVSLPLAAPAKKLPGDDARKDFVLELNKWIEHENDYVAPSIRVAGKEHDVLEMWFLHGTEKDIEQWEHDHVEPMRPRAKALGFHTIRLKLPDLYHSLNYPKGEWVIDLTKTERRWDDPVQP
jgi:hypothetical protein